MTTKLKEAGVLGKISGKKSWYARLIATGSGSSGFYTAEALQNTGPAAWPIGTHINADHQSWEDYMNFPAGSVKTLIGVISSTPEYKDDGTDLPGLYGNVEFSDEWAPFVEQFAPYLGMSIQAQGYGETTTAEGQTIIDGFVPSVLNTVDLVTAAGAKGKLIDAIESYKESDTLITKIVENLTTNESREDIGMKPEDITALAEALATALAPAFTKITEALTPVVEEALKEDAVDNAEVVEALIVSDLPKAGRIRVFEAIKSGIAVVEAIASEKEYVAEVLKESAAAVVGKIQESASTSSDYLVGGWTK